MGGLVNGAPVGWGIKSESVAESVGALGDRGAVECFGCGAPMGDEVGVYYCPTCTARQVEEEEATAEAFVAYHRWAGAIARGNR